MTAPHIYHVRTRLLVAPNEWDHTGAGAFYSDITRIVLERLIINITTVPGFPLEEIMYSL